MIQACPPLKAEGGTMTFDEVERMNALCKQIEIEIDQHKFSQLIAELNELWQRKKQRLDNRDNPHLPPNQNDN
jgi:hypothetical protein